MGGSRTVVGVALVHRGRVLAARRASPPELAGGWELPGGKCEPGESLEDAARRELHEELGCVVRVTGRLPGSTPVGGGATLVVVAAVLEAGEPLPLEHDALRWLGPGELGEVAWLAADVPFLADVAALLA